MKRKVIYAISGKANSGKDTVASIILYLSIKGFIDNIEFNNQYKQWFYYRDRYAALHNNLHFADNLKTALASIFCVDKVVFNNRAIKDKYCLKLNDYTLIDINDIEKSEDNIILANDDLEDMTIEQYLYHFNKLGNKNIYISIRTLMQHFATKICREIIDENIWVKSLLKHIDKLNDDVVCVSNVRFKNEQEALLKLKETKGYKVVTIKIIREDNKNNDTHESEKINFNCDYEIVFEDLKQLFTIIKKIYYENRIS